MFFRVIFSLHKFLLTYNSDALQLIYLKYTIQWFLVYSQSYIYCHYLIPELFLSPPKGTPYPSEVTFYFLFFKSWTATDLLSVSMELRGQYFCTANQSEHGQVCLLVKTHLECLEAIKVQGQAHTIHIKSVKPLKGWTVKSNECWGEVRD